MLCKNEANWAFIGQDDKIKVIVLVCDDCFDLIKYKEGVTIKMVPPSEHVQCCVEFK